MASAGLIWWYDDTLCCFVFRKKTPWTVNQAVHETDLQQNNMLCLITYSSVMNNEKTAAPWSLKEPPTQCKAIRRRFFLKLEALSFHMQHLRSLFHVVLSTCLPGLPFCSGDWGIITEIYIVFKEIGGVSPGVMFTGPSLLWSALNRWFLPSL